MKIRVSLGDADRERLGAPEHMEVDPFKVSIRETVVLQKGVKIEGALCSYDSAAEWRTALGTGDAFALLVLVWLCLRRAGISQDLAELEISDDARIEVDREATDTGEPGKDLSTPETTS